MYFLSGISCMTHSCKPPPPRNSKENYLLQKYGLQKDNYVLMTWHRQENTSGKERMEKILDFLGQVECKILFPIHPRTKKMLKSFGLWEQAADIEQLIMIDPVGYSDMVYLQSNAKIILTDSGGLSKESVFAGVKCLFMLDLHLWPDLERIGWVQHVDFEITDSVNAALKMITGEKAMHRQVDFYGDGNAAGKIVDILEKRNYLIS